MMQKNFPLLFGGIVAYILLLLYSCTVIYMSKKVIEHGVTKPATDEDGKLVKKEPCEFNAGITYVVTTIGGLVSALVVSRLTITKPGESPALVRSLDSTSAHANRLYSFLNIAYLVAWLATGLIALVVGVMVFPESNATLGDIGTTWLGLAVASGFAYFGLTPSPPSGSS